MSIKSKFCAKCGRQTAQLADGICTDCRLGSSLIEVPKKVVLKVCKDCGAFEMEGLWVKSNEPEQNYFENALIKKAKIPVGAELESVGLSGNGQVSVTINFEGRQFTQAFPVQTQIKRSVCPECSMHRRKQYVAVLQLRASESDIEKMRRMVSKFENYVLKFEEQRTGLDVYLTNKEVAKQIAGELRSKFNLWTKESGQAYSWDKQKNRPKYKLTILLRVRE